MPFPPPPASISQRIDNDGVVKGLGDVQHVCEAISSKIRDYMDPLPEVEMIPHDIDGLHILQLNVYAGHYTPYYYVGDGQRIAFVRVGDESMPATAEQMVRLVLKGSNKTYDSLHTDYKVEANVLKCHIHETILHITLHRNTENHPKTTI